MKTCFFFLTDACVEALQVIRDIIPVSGSETSPKILNAVSPLLISAGLDMRLAICDLLGVLAKTDPSVLSVVIIFVFVSLIILLYF